MPVISVRKGHYLRTTDAQVRLLMKEYRKTGKKGVSAVRAGMCRNTGSKYLKLGKLPSELKEPRTWRTRPDAFEEYWPEISERLQNAPELEAKALFEYLLSRYPDQLNPGQLRTFQRRLKQWRAKEGPEREVFFSQEHRPGEAMQTDFTWGSKLGVIIGGEPFTHMLCHTVLPYSNWEWATICRSESLAALKRGVQAAVFRLGRVPRYHQTDNSTAATHNLTESMRTFNEEYVRFMEELDMEPRTIAPGAKEQNGDVEALNGALKRRLKQHLLLRGSSNFESVQEYEQWLGEVLDKANRLKTKRLHNEMEVMKPLRIDRLPEFTEMQVRVTSHSTISVKKNVYSVPSRLIGEMVKVRIYDDRLEIFYADTLQFNVERLLGRGGHRINYRHIIWSLVRKPRAFRLFKYREDLFPSMVFRKAYDTLCQTHDEHKAALAYLRILHLAASTMETEVEAALSLVLENSSPITLENVKDLMDVDSRPALPEMDAFEVDLSGYDALLPMNREVVL
jgi:transposase